MWFKNLQLFQFVDKLTLSAEALEHGLTDAEFVPCGAHDSKKEGWVSPSDQMQTSLVHAANGMFIFCLKTEEKLIPASVVKEEFVVKQKEFEALHQRKMGKQEKIRLKEDIYHSLLPRAFSKLTLTHAYIDPVDGWLIVNAATAVKAESLLAQLRNRVSGLKLQVPVVQSVPLLLTSWLKRNIDPKAFMIEDVCVLSDHQEGGVIRCQRQNLMGDDIQTLLDGREVSQLAVRWQEQISFVLTQDFVIKSLKFLEIIQDQANDTHTETAAQKFDADFSLMALTIRGLLNDLMKIFAKEVVVAPVTMTKTLDLAEA